MKKWLVFIFGFLFTSLILATTYISLAPSPGHYASNISINVKGQNITLQEAIDTKILLGYNLAGVFIRDYLNDNSHSGNEISVVVLGVQKTLQEAINSGTLCSNSVSTYISQSVNPGHYGNQTLVKNLSGSEKSIQEMIDEGEFCTCGDSICQNSSNLNNYGENESNCDDDCYIDNFVGEWVIADYRIKGCDGVCLDIGKVSGFTPEGYTCKSYGNYGTYFSEAPPSSWYVCKPSSVTIPLLTECYCV